MKVLVLEFGKPFLKKKVKGTQGWLFLCIRYILVKFLCVKSKHNLSWSGYVPEQIRTIMNNLH